MAKIRKRKSAPKRRTSARDHRTMRKQMKYNYKTQLGNNKGKTARTVARASALSAAMQGTAAAQQRGETDRHQMDLEYFGKFNGSKPNSGSSNNNSNTQSKPNNNSSSSNIIGWIN